MPHTLVSKLTQREGQVLSRAATGQHDHEIALGLGVSTHTVRSYWKRIRNKTGTGSRTDIVRIWSESKQSEQLRRTSVEADLCHSVVDSLPFPLFALDHQGCIVGCNREAESLIGEPREALVGSGNTAVHSLTGYGEILSQLLDKSADVGAGLQTLSTPIGRWVIIPFNPNVGGDGYATVILLSNANGADRNEE